MFFFFFFEAHVKVSVSCCCKIAAGVSNFCRDVYCFFSCFPSSEQHGYHNLFRSVRPYPRTSCRKGTKYCSGKFQRINSLLQNHPGRGYERIKQGGLKKKKKKNSRHAKLVRAKLQPLLLLAYRRKIERPRGV